MPIRELGATEGTGVDGRAGDVIAGAISATGLENPKGWGEESTERAKGTESEAEVVSGKGTMLGQLVGNFVIVFFGGSVIERGAEMREALAACLAFRSRTCHPPRVIFGLGLLEKSASNCKGTCDASFTKLVNDVSYVGEIRMTISNQLYRIPLLRNFVLNLGLALL